MSYQLFVNTAVAKPARDYGNGNEKSAEAPRIHAGRGKCPSMNMVK
jgi:hypothetical protein